ncbi:unnamed protein product, partial [Prorocentrum cordatum]
FLEPPAPPASAFSPRRAPPRRRPPASAGRCGRAHGAARGALCKGKARAPRAPRSRGEATKQREEELEEEEEKKKEEEELELAPAKRSALEGRGLERQPPCSQGARQPGSAVGEDTRGGGGGEGGGKKGGGGGGGGAPGLRQARDTSRPYPSHFPPRSPPKLAWDTHRLGRRQLTNTSSGGKPSQRHISTSLIAEGLTAGRSRGGVLGLKMLHYSR